MVKIKGLNTAKKEIEEIKQALKTKNLITDADLLNAKEKIKSDKQKAK